MASPDEAFARKKNVVHQTRLTMELQQIEKKRNVCLREMDKSSHVFMRRLAQMREVRRRANLPRLRRAGSAPLTMETVETRKDEETSQEVQETTAGDVNLPFITKSLKLESPVSPRQLSRAKSNPSSRFYHLTSPEAKNISVDVAPSNSAAETRAKKSVGFIIRDHSKPTRNLYPRQSNVPPATAGRSNSLGRVKGRGILLHRRKSESNLQERRGENAWY